MENYQLKLAVFEGPFDLLLYLIKKNQIDIYDIPIAKITEEYLAYLEVMRKTGRGARLSVEVLVKQERLIFAVFGCLIGTVVPLVLILLAMTHVLVGSTLILMLISAICRSSGDLALRYSFLRVGIYDPIY